MKSFKVIILANFLIFSDLLAKKTSFDQREFLETVVGYWEQIYQAPICHKTRSVYKKFKDFYDALEILDTSSKEGCCYGLSAFWVLYPEKFENIIQKMNEWKKIDGDAFKKTKFLKKNGRDIEKALTDIMHFQNFQGTGQNAEIKGGKRAFGDCLKNCVLLGGVDSINSSNLSFKDYLEKNLNSYLFVGRNRKIDSKELIKALEKALHHNENVKILLGFSSNKVGHELAIIKKDKNSPIVAFDPNYSIKEYKNVRDLVKCMYEQVSFFSPTHFDIQKIVSMENSCSMKTRGVKKSYLNPS